jgi:hypothetical protein
MNFFKTYFNDAIPLMPNLLEDFKKLIPHHKTDNKLDTKGDIRVVNEIAEMKKKILFLLILPKVQVDLWKQHIIIEAKY